MSELTAFCLQQGIAICENEPMSKRTTFKAGGNADYFISVSSEKELFEVLKFCGENEIRTMILGAGSNVLFKDDGYKGAVINLKGDFLKTELSGEKITAGAGLMLNKLAVLARDNSLEGLEFSYGIPGTVGGAVYMNAGAYGGEVKDVLLSVRAMDIAGNIKEYSAETALLSYRSSVFQKTDEVILSAEFLLKKGNREEIKARMDELYGRRKAKQPLEYPSAGSTFKRPEGYFAAALIEECGLKGESVGGAEVSRKHSGFIINKNGATASDIEKLIEKVKETVREKKGVKLECEVKIIGGVDKCNV